MRVYIHLLCINTQRQVFFVIVIITDDFTMLILQKYGFKVCVISFGFYSNRYKVYIYITCINIQQQTTAPFDITHVISYSNHQTPRLYQGSADHCEGDHNYNIICLLQLSKTIHYCTQSVLAIVPDLNIFVWSITIFDLILRSALV